MEISLVIADNHPIFLAGLTRLLDDTGEFKVLATCANGGDALAAVRRSPPDILLIDFRIPGINGLEVARALKAEAISVATVLMVGSLQRYQTNEAFQRGVAGIIPKTIGSGQLNKCLRTVYAGGRWFESAVAVEESNMPLAREPIPTNRSDLRDLLTPREIEVARHVAVGLRNREIAEKLFIDEGTVKVHLHRIVTKLNLRGRHALGAFMRDHWLM